MHVILFSEPLRQVADDFVKVDISKTAEGAHLAPLPAFRDLGIFGYHDTLST